MAETLCRLLPSIEMVRLVSSGTEATMSALRLARGFTGRSKIVKFEGCYHGHGDSLLVKAGSGALTFGQPSSAGVPPAIANETIVLPYNDLAAVEAAFAARRRRHRLRHRRADRRQHEPDHAARRVSSQGLRALCDQHGAVLIFDEVMTGFRVHPRGVQGLYGITPDLTTLGKVIGGGMPVGAFGGKRAIMEKIAPLGPGLPGGHAVGQPGGGRRGARDARRRSRRPASTTALAATTRSLCDGLAAAARARRRAVRRRSRSAACSDSTSRPRCPTPTTR